MPWYCICRQKARPLAVFFADAHGPEWPMRITARPRRLLAGPCRVKERGGTREGEAESPGNRRLPDFVVLLVGLRNRSKFRFALCRAPVCHLVSLHVVLTSPTLHLSRGVAHLEYTSSGTLISVSQNCKHFFAKNSLHHARDHIDRMMESVAHIIRTSSRRS